MGLIGRHRMLARAPSRRRRVDVRAAAQSDSASEERAACVDT